MRLVVVNLFKSDSNLCPVGGTSLLVLTLVVTIVGCGRAPKLRPGWAIVSGTVTYQGKPLPGGEVMWCTTKEGASVARGGPIGEDGTFTLDTPTGVAKVA